MQRQQPGKKRQAQGRRQQQPGAMPLAQPEPGQIAANDFCHGGGGKQAQGFQEFHDQPSGDIGLQGVAHRLLLRLFPYRCHALHKALRVGQKAILIGHHAPFLAGLV